MPYCLKGSITPKNLFEIYTIQIAINPKLSTPTQAHTLPIAKITPAGMQLTTLVKTEWKTNVLYQSFQEYTPSNEGMYSFSFI